MDRPSADHVAQGGPGDRVQGLPRLLGFGDETPDPSAFPEKPLPRPHAIARHAGRHGVRTRVAIRLDQAELQHLALFGIAGELIDRRHESFSGA
jgi:hypothetical protein